jgi:hypothetical protein
VDVRDILALPIPFETEEPIAKFFVRGAISESEYLSSLMNMPMARSSPAGPHKNLIVGTGPRGHCDLQRGEAHADAFSLFAYDLEYFGAAVFAGIAAGR